MAGQNQPNQGAQRGLLTVALVALVLALLALAWGVRALYRLGALGAPRARAAATATAVAVPAATGAAPQTAVALASTPLSTLEPIQLPTAAPLSTNDPSLSLTPIAPEAPGAAYEVEYRGCIEHGSNTGTVKGQVFDRQGQIVVGAEVRVTLNDWVYDRPGITNRDGWYEFYLDRGLEVKIVSLRIDGREMPLVGHEALVVESQGGCYENINFRQR